MKIKLTSTVSYKIMSALKDGITAFQDAGHSLPSNPFITLPSGVDVDLSSITLPTDLTVNSFTVKFKGTIISSVSLPNVEINPDLMSVLPGNGKIWPIPNSEDWYYSREGQDHILGTAYGTTQYYWLPSDGFDDGKTLLALFGLLIILDYAGLDILSKFVAQAFFFKNRFSQTRTILEMSTKMDNLQETSDDIEAFIDGPDGLNSVTDNINSSVGIVDSKIGVSTGKTLLQILNALDVTVINDHPDLKTEIDALYAFIQESPDYRLLAINLSKFYVNP